MRDQFCYGSLTASSFSTSYSTSLFFFFSSWPAIHWHMPGTPSSSEHASKTNWLYTSSALQSTQPAISLSSYCHNRSSGALNLARGENGDSALCFCWEACKSISSGGRRITKTSSACAASSIRLYYAIRLYYSTDQTYRAALMGKWAEPELTFGFLAACLPVLPAFIKHLLRTSVGLKIRGFWTQSPLTDGRSTEGRYDRSGGRQVKTIGSYGRSGEKSSRITKVVEMNIEFEELTRESRDGTRPVAEQSRGSSRERDEEWGVVGGKGPKQEANVWPLRP